MKILSADSELNGAARCADVPAAAPESVPAAVPVRGFMLDVSRGRVPTMSALFSLIDVLEKLRFNQLQLYVEHTFAFARHEVVWRDASPLTAEEIRAADAYCSARGIELVPNLNSLGHVERWLKHEAYRHLAECPDGFFHEVFKMHRAAGTFAVGEESADFMGELYREFLPNFSSEKFNVGGDEPWELGQGRSRALCEKIGRRAAYVGQMIRLKKRAEACGKKIMFWGDVLLGEDGALPPEFLAGTIPVVWGYEAGHPFDAQCFRVRAALEEISGGNGRGNAGGAEFYLAAGTSSWLSFGTRQTNAFANIRAACAAARRHGARGVLLTAWGDFGYHNPYSANLLPLIFASAEMRGVPAPTAAADFAPALAELGFPDAAAFAEALFSFGKLDDFISKKITNRSWIREVFFAKSEALPRLAEGVPADEIAAAKAACARVLKIAERVPAVPAVREFRVAAEMAFAALRRAEALVRNDAGTLAAVEAEIAGTLREKFAGAWRLFAREGGLSEALDYFIDGPSA